MKRATVWRQPSRFGPDLARSVVEVADAVVFLEQDGVEATGFVVGDSTIITAAHVVDEGRSVRVRFRDGEVRTAFVIAQDGPLDVAVLAVLDLPPSVRRVDWQSSSTPAPATPLWSWGFPLGDPFGPNTNVSVAGGLVSAIQTNSRGFTVIQTDAAATSGSSGGPVVTEDGRLVGIVISIITRRGVDVEGLNLAVDVATNRTRIAALLDN